MNTYRIYVMTQSGQVKYWVYATRKSLQTVAQSVHASLRNSWLACAVKYNRKTDQWDLLGEVTAKGVRDHD